MTTLTTPLKQLIKDSFFLSAEEVDNIASISSYATPIQSWLNMLAVTYTAYEVNYALPIIQKYFAGYTSAKIIDNTLLLERHQPVYKCLTLVPSRGKITVYETVPSLATSSGFARLEKT